MKLLNWSCQKIHCSVDDTLWIFKDLTEHKEYVSIFENPILNKIKENSILKGITISGGEPLCKENVGEVLKFIKNVKQEKPNFNVWCYTGYTFEELKNRKDEETDKCLNEIDVLVDGKFEIEKKIPNLKFKGSTNQRIIDVQKSLKQNEIVIFEV